MAELQWRIPGVSDEGHQGNYATKVLHYRTSADKPWEIYSKHPLAAPDRFLPSIPETQLPHMMQSRGMATMQKLLGLGYKMVLTPGVEREASIAAMVK